jgi:hypothetical protein
MPLPCVGSCQRAYKKGVYLNETRRGTCAMVPAGVVNLLYAKVMLGQKGV